MEINTIRNNIIVIEKLIKENEKIKVELEEIKIENDYLIKENQDAITIIETYESLYGKLKNIICKQSSEITNLNVDIIKKDKFIDFQSQYIFKNIDN